ncbi:MAG: lipid-A-disaccharide synthase [Omnitrophica bacterium]|nr:lipid-A-disaccharide synthase [Candidatus Omnitrophota bacterium]
MKKNVLIIAGETSGDIHAANLVQSLRKLNSNFRFFGIGGKRMESQGVELIERMEKLSVVGIFEVFFKFHNIFLAYRKIMQSAAKMPPEIVILVDYPGFNLRMAKIFKKRGATVIYYITPQVWAWGRSRVHLIKKYVDKAIVIFKFEEDFFKQYGINATFVGHPLLDLEKGKSTLDKKSLGLNEGDFTIAILPGSRESEVKGMLPVMLKAATLIAKKKEISFVLLKSSGVDENIYARILKNTGLRITPIKDDTHGGLSVSDFVLVSSGTATLESALMERPMLITYKLSFFSALIFKIFANTRFIGLVNIIAGREIAPEVLQYDATPERLAERILSIISSKEKMGEQVNGLREVRRLLGQSGASMRAAHIINELIG